MNREERRALKRKNKSRGLSSVNLASKLDDNRRNEIHDGDLVKLNVSQIISRKEFSRLQEEYRKFVMNSRGKVFTAHPYRARTDGFSAVMCLDGTEWTFWYGDLIKVEEGV